MMMSTHVPLVYLMHPVGNGPARQLNVRNAKLWVRLLVELIPHVAIVAPWIPYVEVLEEEGYRERGMRDDLHTLQVCHAAVACGGRYSPGMCTERDMFAAITPARPIVDLTDLPVDPVIIMADGQVGRLAQMIRERFRAVT